MLGGLHLTGAVFEPIIAPTLEALKDIASRLVMLDTARAGKPFTHLHESFQKRMCKEVWALAWSLRAAHRFTED